MIPIQYALRHRMMVAGWGGGANIAKLKPDTPSTYEQISGAQMMEVYESAMHELGVETEEVI